MEVQSEEGDMPLPINSIHHDLAPHNHIIIPISTPQLASNGPISSTIDDHGHDVKIKKIVKYRECLKNHAAAMGGNATDGCGEFMPSGEEGSLEALTCSACNCHRNFHRKEIEGEQLSSWDCFTNQNHFNKFGRKIIVGNHHNSFSGHENLLIPSRGGAPPPPHQMIMPYNMGCFPSESDEQEDGGGGGGGDSVHQLVKKRFRTKFTPEQKEKMLQFAEKVGWKMQKQEESLVQQFCQEVGVKRRTFKVWMHNNKSNLAKKDNNDNAQNHIARDFDSHPVSISDPS